MTAEIEVVAANDADHDVLIRVTGILGFTTVRKVMKKIDFAQHAGKNVQVDLADVEDIDSAGIALCLEWLDRAHKHDVQVRFVNPPPTMEQLVKVNRVEELIR